MKTASPAETFTFACFSHASMSSTKNRVPDGDAPVTLPTEA